MSDPIKAKSPTIGAQEAAELLEISRSSVYEAMRTGQLPHIKIGRRKLIARSKIEQMLGICDDVSKVDPSGARRLVLEARIAALEDRITELRAELAILTG